MTVKELREKRYALAKEVRRLADLVNTENRDFTAEERKRWEEVNAEYDGLTRRIEVAERGETIDAELRDDRVVNNPRGIGREDLDPGNPEGEGAGGAPGSPSGMVFRDQATGRLLRAYRGQDRMARVPDFAQPDLLGRTVQAILTGNLDLLSAEERAQTGAIATQGGFLLSPAVSGLFVDLARAASVAVRAGAQTVPMETSELTIARVSADPTGQWRAEAQPITASEIALSGLTLQARTLAVLVPVSIELAMDAPNAPQLIQQVMREHLALKLDQAVLVGTGAENQPLGIRNYGAGVNSVPTVGAPAAADAYDHIVDSVQLILADNYAGPLSGLSWVGHPRDSALLQKLKGSDSQPVRPPPWVEQLQKFDTTSIPTNEGGGSNESVALVGDFAQVVIGMRTTGVRIEVFGSGQAVDGGGVTRNAVSDLLVWVRAYLRADVGLLQPTHFTVASGITLT